MTGYKDMLYIFIITAMNIVIWYAVPFFLLQCRFRPTVLRVGAFLTLQFVLVVGIRYVLSFPFVPQLLPESPSSKPGDYICSHDGHV